MFLRSIVASVGLLAVPAAVMADTRVDIDRTRDFSQYKTFDVKVSAPVRDGEVDEYDTIGVNRLRQAVTSALRARGLILTDGEADLTVRVGIRETERTELVSSGLGYGWYGPWGYGFGGYGYGGYGYWGAPYGGGDVWTYRYLEGTTRIDVIERATGDLVYRAEVTAEVDDDEEDLDEDAVKIAGKAFRKFPARGVYAD